MNKQAIKDLAWLDGFETQAREAIRELFLRCGPSAVDWISELAELAQQVSEGNEQAAVAFSKRVASNESERIIVAHCVCTTLTRVIVSISADIDEDADA